MILLSLMLAASAQQNSASIRAAMLSSLNLQRESVRRQELASRLQAPMVARTVLSQTPTACGPLPADEVNTLIQQAAKQESVDPDLVKAVARRESGFRPCAVSSKGAAGLMQLMPGTIQDLEVDNPFDPRQNITAGTRFLKQLLERYQGDIASALGAYNAGPARVDKAGGVPAIAETQRYVTDILSTMP